MLRRTAATFIAATLLCWLAAGLLLNTAAAAPTPSRAASARLQGDETATASPTSPPSTNITLSGTVYDLSLGPSAVISGAVVSVLVCQPRRFSTETGPDGYFSLFLPGQYLTGCSQVLLEVYAPGYGFLAQFVSIAELRADPVTNIPLVPAATVTPTASTTATAPAPTGTTTATPVVAATGTPTEVAATGTTTATPVITTTETVTATVPVTTGTPTPSETGTGTPMPSETGTTTATPAVAETGTATATAEAATGTPTPPATGTGTATALPVQTGTTTATPIVVTTGTATPMVTGTTTPTTPTLLTFKQARPDPVEPGGVLTFTIGLMNDMLDTFDPGASVTVYDPVPMSLTVLSDTLPSGAVYNPLTNAVTWQGSVPQGLPVSLTFQAQVALTATGIVTNTAVITDALGTVYQPSAAVIIVTAAPGTATPTVTATATGTPGPVMTGTGTPEATGTPTVQVTGTGTPETTGTPTVQVTGTGTPETTGTPTVEATGTGTPATTVTPTATSTTGVCQSGVVQIDIQNFAFVPQTVTICQGATVRWTNLDTVPHTSTSDTTVWDSGVLNTGQSFSFTFNTIGSFPYHCEIHPDMHGTINVVAAPGATGTPTVEVTGTGTPQTTGTPTTVPSTGTVTATAPAATGTATIVAATTTVTPTAAPSGTATVTATPTPAGQLWLPLIIKSSFVRGSTPTAQAATPVTASLWNIFGWLRGIIGG